LKIHYEVYFVWGNYFHKREKSLLRQVIKNIPFRVTKLIFPKGGLLRLKKEDIEVKRRTALNIHINVAKY